MGDFYGVPGVKFISRNEWSDPTVIYKGHEFNYWDLEESLYYSFQADNPTAPGYGGLDDDSAFRSWIDNNHNAVYGELDDMIFGGCDWPAGAVPGGIA